MKNYIETVNGISFTMVYVEHGTFQMGCPDENAHGYEKPVHTVTLTKDFLIGETPVTQKLWTAVMGDNPSAFKSPSSPVGKVSWPMAWEFIHKLRALTGKNYRLPSEAEWEFAARGGNKSKGYRFAGGDTLEDVAWCMENSGGRSWPVAKLQPNELGIYDMSGNVSEWCQDNSAGYSAEACTDPIVENGKDLRIIRGGGAFMQASSSVWWRAGAHITEMVCVDQGFRLAI